MKENIYKITYKIYQVCKAIPFGNLVPSVFDADKIVSIECIERNNDID